jgi:hypothetical protein
MRDCPHRTEGCSVSRPCHKCRMDSSHRAHVLIRFDSRGTRRQTRQIGRAHYIENPTYWERVAA